MDIRLETGPSETVSVETWTSSPQSLVDWSAKPIALYAYVADKQRRAISGLKVTAKIIGSGGSTLQVALEEDGPADVTKGDGIYSALLVDLPKQSSALAYVVEIINSTGTIDSGTYSGHPSAGSLIPVNQSTATDHFIRYVYGGSFGLTRPYDGQDAWPPTRVKDLTISWYNNSMVELVWSAPKDNYGSSSAYGKLQNVLFIKIEENKVRFSLQGKHHRTVRSRARPRGVLRHHPAECRILGPNEPDRPVFGRKLLLQLLPNVRRGQLGQPTESAVQYGHGVRDQKSSGRSGKFKKRTATRLALLAADRHRYRQRSSHHLHHRLLLLRKEEDEARGRLGQVRR